MVIMMHSVFKKYLEKFIAFERLCFVKHGCIVKLLNGAKLQCCFGE